MLTWFKKLFIPKGFYCYKTTRIIPDKVYGFRMKIRTCPFYKQVWDVDGTCLLLNTVVLDQCKVCGINEDIVDELG